MRDFCGKPVPKRPVPYYGQTASNNINMPEKVLNWSKNEVNDDTQKCVSCWVRESFSPQHRAKNAPKEAQNRENRKCNKLKGKKLRFNISFGRIPFSPQTP